MKNEKNISGARRFCHQKKRNEKIVLISFEKVNEKGVSRKKKMIGKVLDGNKLFRRLRDKWNVVYKVSSTFPKGHSRICKNG